MYDILEAGTRADLVAMVNAKEAEGWQILGGMTALFMGNATYKFFQAIQMTGLKTPDLKSSVITEVRKDSNKADKRN